MFINFEKKRTFTQHSFSLSCTVHTNSHTDLYPIIITADRVSSRWKKMDRVLITLPAMTELDVVAVVVAFST
jgi:hypothetical protein